MQQYCQKVELFSLTAVARVLVIGCTNKLAEVVEHVLGLKNVKRVFKNSAGKGSNDKAKKRMQKNRNFEAASRPF